MSELVRGALPLLASHLELTLIALAAGIFLAFPLTLASLRWPRLRYPILTATALVQTIPGLALLALMVPLLAATGGLFLGLPAFGAAPAILALTLYALLPILRNAVTGIAGVDAAAVEAAHGMGMTPRQVLFKVELPLAAPVIAAGIRTAATWTVGAATLATPVGQRCLGNYLFTGLQTRNWPMLLVGVAAASGLALILDLVLAGVERSLAGRHPRRALWPLAALAVLVGAALLSPRFLAEPASTAPVPVTTPGTRAAVTHVRLGAKTFTEQYILVELLRQRLEAVGLEVEVTSSLGSTVIFDALRQGDLDVYVDYSGTLYANVLRRAGAARWQVLAEVEGFLAQQGVRSLGPLGFENAYALAVRRTDLATIGDLPPGLRLGADYEFLGRPEWTALRDAYGLRFASTTSYDPSFLYDALARGQADVIAVFSSDGRIAADGLVVLADPAGVLPPYDAMLLLGPKVATDARVVCALAPLRDALPVELMRRANLMVDRAETKATPAEAARWLLSEARIPAPSCPP